MVYLDLDGCNTFGASISIFKKQIYYYGSRNVTLYFDDTKFSGLGHTQ